MIGKPRAESSGSAQHADTMPHTADVTERCLAVATPNAPEHRIVDPEIVAVGLAPDEAKATGANSVTGVCPFAANGRALTMADGAGFVRIVARAGDHVVLGVQAVGRGLSELAAGSALALEMGARLEDIAATMHGHPTQSEALQEAAL